MVSWDKQLRRSCIFILDDITLPNLNSSKLIKSGSLEELLPQIQKSYQEAIHTLIVTKDRQYPKLIQTLRKTLASEIENYIGVLVLTQQVDSFLQTTVQDKELLDVCSIDNFTQAPEHYLSKGLWHLLRRYQKENLRVGRQTLEKLNQIFIKLSTEKDAQRLLATILIEAIDLTKADGGSLFVVEEIDGELVLKSKLCLEGGSEMLLQHPKEKATEHSLSGYVALTGKIHNIDVLSEVSPHVFPQYDPNIDHFKSVSVKSVITIPLINSRNEVIGILQLINCNRRGLDTHHFDQEEISILSSFATQATICIENVALYQDIEKLFEGFAKASITAIEARDPSTGGHSERVAKMSVALAKAVSDCQMGIYRSVKFKPIEIRELEYAALLHDFGKIGVREEVLVKAKKLYPFQLESIKQRLRLWRVALSVKLQSDLSQENKDKKLIQFEYEKKLKKMDEYWNTIVFANEPSVLKSENIKLLDEIRAEKLSLDSFELELLNDEEFQALSITKGSLTESERLEVESHVRHTFQFLKMIPWTKSFKNLPEIAYGHHEKLDGTGYPRGLLSHEIALQSKIMTIPDIYDALTAADRWYKDAVPIEKALDILNFDVKEGKLDPVLFDIFVQNKVYELIQPKTKKVKY